MSSRPTHPSTRPGRRSRRLHMVGVFLTAITAVAALVAVNSASVGASPTPAAVSDTPAPNSPADVLVADHRAALGDVEWRAVDTLRAHAPELTDSVWCDAMGAHEGDWDGFADKVATAADNWSTSEDGMFEFVGVVVQSVCPERATAFLASTVG